MRVFIPPGDMEAARLGLARSPAWPSVERWHLRGQPRCVACAEGTNLEATVQVHHLFPFHYCVALGRKDLELDPRNLLTLCEGGTGAQNHHLLVGHLDSFSSANLNARADARLNFHGLDRAQLQASARWQEEVRGRLKPLDEMSGEEKEALRRLMDATFPR